MIHRIQPREFVDHITDDGQEFTRKPYPFYADEAGDVQRQDFWKGRVAKVIGFVDDVDSVIIQPFWQQAIRDPESVIGKYLVTSDDQGQWSTHQQPISELAPVACQ